MHQKKASHSQPAGSSMRITRVNSRKAEMLTIRPHSKSRNGRRLENAQAPDTIISVDEKMKPNGSYSRT